MGDREAFERSVFRKRSRHALERSGVMTVGQLRAMPPEELRDLPGIGPKADIESLLGDRTLCAEDPLWCVTPPAARLISERDADLIRMRQQGVALAQIATRFGISRERVRQILDRDGC